MQKLFRKGLLTVAIAILVSGPALVSLIQDGDATTTTVPAAGTKNEVMVLTWRIPSDVIASSNGSDFMPRMPENVPILEDAAANTLPTIVQLRDRSGKVVAVASEIGMPRPHKPTMKRGETFEIAYSIAVPGRGMLYTWCLESFDPALAKLEAETRIMRAEGKVWTGRVAGIETVGPRSDNKCDVTHGSGEFEGVTGTFYKEHVITRVDNSRAVLGMSGETHFYLDLHLKTKPAPTNADK